jgi:hypothetical protein
LHVEWGSHVYFLLIDYTNGAQSMDKLQAVEAICELIKGISPHSWSLLLAGAVSVV